MGSLCDHFYTQTERGGKEKGPDPPVLQINETIDSDRALASQQRPVASDQRGV